MQTHNTPSNPAPRTVTILLGRNRLSTYATLPAPVVKSFAYPSPGAHPLFRDSAGAAPAKPAMAIPARSPFSQAPAGKI